MRKSVLRSVFVCFLLLLSLGGRALAEGAVFADVSAGDWYYEGVQYAYAQGYMNGTGDGSFSPGLPTTRGMLVTILHRMEGAPSVPVDHGFSDVKRSDYFDKAVQWASFHGIVNGYSPTEFGPQNPVTREQMAAILYRFALGKGLVDEAAGTGDLSAFADAAAVSAYALDALRWARGAGLINGVSADTLAPAGTSTRAQTAVILSRFAQTYLEPAAETPDPAQPGDGGTPASPAEQPEGVAAAAADPNAANLFLLSAVPAEGKAVELTLELRGAVRLCGFDLRLVYDPDAWSLEGLDAGYDLQLFTHSDPESGSVALNYSAAQNITKGKTLLKARFAPKPGADPGALFSLHAVEVIMTDERYEIVDADYTLTYCPVPSGGGAA